MKSILVTSDASQLQTVILDDQSSFQIEIEYRPMQFGWFINSLVYKEFELYGFRITTNVNILNQFINKVPFGIGCLTTDNSEPLLQDDFLSKKATLYLLSHEECLTYGDILSGKIST